MEPLAVMTGIAITFSPCTRLPLIASAQKISAPVLTCCQATSSFTQRRREGEREREIPLTLFDELHKYRVVSAHCKAKTVLVFLNDHASLNQS